MASSGGDDGFDGKSKNSDNPSATCGYKDVNQFSQDALKAVMTAVRSSNELPCAGNDFDYYSSYASFQQYSSMQQTRLLQLIQSVMRYHGARGSIAVNNDLMDVEDRFDILVDANDQLLERVGNLLDEASGLKKEEAELVMVSATPKQPSSGGWNKLTPASSRRSPGYRLLTARHVTRPQSQFYDKIDNSSRPFVPKIVTKPNALRPLADSLVCNVSTSADGDVQDQNLSYPHPYQCELDNYVPDEKFLEKAQLQDALPMETTPLTIVSTEEQLIKLCQLLKTQTEIAVDTEHHSYRTYQGLTCLIQISTRSEDFVVDSLKLREHIHLLNDSFTDPNILKVLHGADGDVVWLQRDFGVYIVGLFDTHQGSRALGFARHRLQDLLQHYCGVEASKEFQLEDWRIRPLPDEFIRYARSDTHYLLCIYDRMKNDLLERVNGRRNLVMSVFTASRLISAKKYEKPHTREDGYKDLLTYNRKVFNARQTEALRSLYLWRDSVARQQDESTGYVLPNLMMLQIAEILPRDPEGILACCTHIPPLVQQYLTELHLLIKDARERPIEKREVPTPTQSVARPRLSKHEYCPHDTSHQPTDGSTADEAGAVDIVVDVCDKPMLTAFGDVIEQTDAERTPAQCRAVDVRNSLSNPFSQYLPIFGPSGSMAAETAAVSLVSEEHRVWRLLPNTVKPAPLADKLPVVEVLETAPKIPFSTVSTAATPKETKLDRTIREQLAVERRKTDDVQSASTTKKKNKKRNKVTADTSDVVGSAKTDASSNSVKADFVPHDYAKANLTSLLQAEESTSLPSAKKKKKKHEFNPNLAIADADHKPAKHRPVHKSANKSMMYGGSASNSLPKIPWPKR